MQTNEQKLESIAESVISIPFGGSDSESDFESDTEEDVEPGSSFPCGMYTPPELARRDLPYGPRLRMKAYEDAFARCRNRVQEVLQEIHAPTVQRVIDTVRDAYCPREEDRLMPYTELRTVAISGTDRSATLAVLEDVRRVLVESGSSGRVGGGTESEGDVLRIDTPVIVSTLALPECSNLTSAMRSMIHGFLESDVGMDGVEEDGQSRPALASYDINLLGLWYDRLRRSRGEANLPKLVIVVTDLEKIEPAIMQDLFYICSLHVPRLPFVFVLGLSTPSTPSYLHAAFPRRTLALLQATRIEVAGGRSVLERVLNDTFFDAGFEPTIMMSPAVLEFIFEQFMRTAQSIEFIVFLLQLVYLRHFTEPLSALASDELLGTRSIKDSAEKISAPDCRPFLLTLLARMQFSAKSAVSVGGVPFENGVRGDDDTSTRTPLEIPTKRKGKARANGANGVPSDANWTATSPLEVLTRVRKLRREHEARLRRARVAFRIASEVRRQLVEAGILRVEDGRGAGVGRSTVSEADMMCICLRGTFADKSGKALGNGIRKLDMESLRSLLSGLYGIVDGLPEKLRAAEQSTLTLFSRWSSSLDELVEEELDARDIADEVSTWLVDHISENTYDFTETRLWDVWYTGNPTGISEMFNPAPRTAIISALMHPERYLGNEEHTDTASKAFMPAKGKRRAVNSAESAQAENVMPDTAFLFKGYLEGGRMLNVYDWYMMFKEGLEARRRAMRNMGSSSRTCTRGTKVQRKSLGIDSQDQTPTKSRGRGRRGRGRGRGRGSRGSRSKGRLDTELASDDGGDDNNNTSETGDDNEDDLSPEERERWEAEVQTRFLRSIQELDLMGFIKHTGRKADHVQKTVFELPEYA